MLWLYKCFIKGHLVREMRKWLFFNDIQYLKNKNLCTAVVDNSFVWWNNYLLDVLLDTLIENKPAIIVITSRKRLKGECYELLDSNIGHKSI